MQVPSDFVMTVRPSEELDAELLAPGPLRDVTPPPAVLVEPETAPPPALTELVTPSALVLLVSGGRSPGLR